MNKKQEAKTTNDWRKWPERLPKTPEFVLVCWGLNINAVYMAEVCEKGANGKRYVAILGKTGQTIDGYNTNIKYWMPLPKPPMS
uniref:DUF551 domain-containing protein n=1 Tax=viral metagenome TaxID=1070528 RepID=A0A6M3JHY7_9ZZZZ